MKFKSAVITAIKFVLSLVFIIALIILAWSLLTSMVKVFGDQTKSVEPTIIVAIISGLGAIIVNAISKNSERKNEAFMKSKEKMIEVYETFLKEIDCATNEEKNEVLKKYDSLFAVNASDDTYNEFLFLKNNENKDTTRLIVSIRNEMKVSNKKNKKRITRHDAATADRKKLDLCKGDWYE